jgi:malonyl-CoA O-methyltransferase
MSTVPSVPSSTSVSAIPTASELKAVEPFFLDRAAFVRNAAKSAATFATHDALHREVSVRMAERLDYIKVTPRRIVDLGCGVGGSLAMLEKRYPKAEIIALDISEHRLKKACPSASSWQRLIRTRRPLGLAADMAALPLAHSSIGMAFSNLALHWLDDPAPALREAARVLEPGALLMFSSLGPDTLKELRDAAAPRLSVRRFIDLHDIGDVLVGAGFATPVMDMEKITLTYASVDALLADLRATGSANPMTGRARGLSGRAFGKSLRERLHANMQDGRFSVSFEVIYGHAWKGVPRKTAAGDTIIRFDRGAPR